MGLPEINAGVPDKSAIDAWYKTAILIEEALLKQLKVARVSVDVLKCFAQINREIVRKVAQKAGMPIRILDAYFKYIDNLNIRFQYGDKVGKAHKRRCSIPQGCPFSMTMVALMFVPWVNLIKKNDMTQETVVSLKL